MEENKDIQTLTDQVKDLGNTVKDAVQKAQENIEKSVGDKLEAKADAEEVKNLKEEIKALKAAQGTRMVAEQKGVSFDEQLREAIKKGAEMYANQKGNYEIQLKTAITSDNFTHDTTGNTRVYAEQREAGINKAPKRSPFIRGLAFNGTATSDTISWNEKVGESGNPIPLAELDSYPEETSSWQAFSTPVKKIGGMTKVSEEKLADVEWMMNEIQSELVQRHDLVVDTQILSGDGTGLNLKGVLTYATAFAAGSFATAVQSPTRVDVLRVAYNQVVTALFQPTFIALHPTDVAFMELSKDANGQYVMPPFASVDGTQIKGLPVVENTGITEGTFLIGDGSRLGVFAKGGAVLEIGRDGNDFSTDQVSVKLRERLAVRVKGRDLAAFVKGTFSTAITAITKP